MRRARTTLSWHPEWPLAAVGLACWLLLVVVALSPEPADHPASHHLSSHADQMNLLGAGDITLMFVGTAAMMIPVGLRSAHHVALSTFRSQRVIALTSFQLGYLLVPIALTAGSSALFVLSGVQDERWLVPVLLVLAAAWQLTPWKTTALGRCARTIPLRPFGWAATWSCTEFGIRRGTRCLEAAHRSPGRL